DKHFGAIEYGCRTDPGNDVAGCPVPVLRLSGKEISGGLIGGILQRHLSEQKNHHFKDGEQRRQKRRSDQGEFDSRCAPLGAGKPGNFLCQASEIRRGLSKHREPAVVSQPPCQVRGQAGSEWRERCSSNYKLSILRTI